MGLKIVKKTDLSQEELQQALDAQQTRVNQRNSERANIQQQANNTFNTANNLATRLSLFNTSNTSNSNWISNLLLGNKNTAYKKYAREKESAIKSLVTSSKESTEEESTKEASKTNILLGQGDTTAYVKNKDEVNEYNQNNSTSFLIAQKILQGDVSSTVNNNEYDNTTTEEIVKNDNLSEDMSSLGKIAKSSFIKQGYDILNMLETTTEQIPGSTGEYFKNIRQRQYFASPNVDVLEKSAVKNGDDSIETNLVKQMVRDKVSEYNEQISTEQSKMSNVVTSKIGELTPSAINSVTGVALSAVNPVLGSEFFIASAGGEYMNDGLSRGMTEEQAWKYGGIMGTLEGVSESIITGQQLSKVVKAFTGNGISSKVLNSYGFNLAENAVQEMIMEPTQEMVATLTGGADTSDWEDMTERMFEAGLNGALLGAISNGVTYGLVKSGEVYQKIQNGEQITEAEYKEALQENIEQFGQETVEQAFKQGATDTYSELNDITEESYNEYKQSNFYSNNINYAVGDMNKIEASFNTQETYSKDEVSEIWNDVEEKRYSVSTKQTDNTADYYSSTSIEEDAKGNLVVNRYDENNNIADSKTIPSNNGKYNASDIQNTIKEVATITDENAPMEGQTDIEGNIVAPDYTNTLENSQETVYNDSNMKESEINDKTIQGLQRLSGQFDTSISKESQQKQTKRYTTAEYEQWEQQVNSRANNQQLTTEQQQLKDSVKRQYNKDIVFFDGENNSNYNAGASLTDSNKIYIDKNTANNFNLDMVAEHEIMENAIRYNRGVSNDIIQPTIEKIINDPNFRQQKTKFWENETDAMPSDYAIAKEILCDRFAEIQTGKSLDYDNVLSQETNMTLDYSLQQFYKELYGKDLNIQNNIAPVPNQNNISNSTKQTEIIAPLEETLESSVKNLERKGIKIPQDRIDTLQSIQNNREGLSIILDDTLQDSKGNVIDGVYSSDSREIRINANSDRSLEWLTIHELAHDLEGTQEYRVLKETVLDYAKQKDNYEQSYQDLYNKYAEYYDNEEMIENEAVNDILAESLGNQEFLNSLAQEQPNVFKRVYNWIKDFIKSIGNKDQQFLNDIQNKFQKAYNEAYNNNTGNSNTKYSIQTDNNGNKYVKIDTDQDIFDGIDKKDYNKIAKMYMQDYLKGNTELSDNDTVKIGNKGISKYTNPKQVNKYISEKMKLSTELKNVLKIAEKTDSSIPTKETSKFPNWEYYKIKFELDGNTFEGTINIGIDKEGNKHFYEINKIHTTSNSYISTSKSSSTDVINTSIAQSKGKSNTNNKYSMQNTENNTQENSNTKYSIAGQKAETANIDTLQKAQQLESQGKTAQEIYEQTGWYRGNEGQWRFEISDSSFNINPDVKLKPNETYYLSDILNAEDLFKAYPKLETTQVTFKNMGSYTRGRFNPSENSITINKDLIRTQDNIKDNELLGIKNQNQVYEALTHEVQHYIQKIEGFSSGSNANYWQEQGQSKSEAYNSYYNTAGEQEARDVVKRTSLSDEERSKQIPFVKDDNTVYAPEFAESFSEDVEKTTDIEYNSDGIVLSSIEYKAVTSAINTHGMDMESGTNYDFYGDYMYIFKKSGFNEYTFTGRIKIEGNEDFIDKIRSKIKNGIDESSGNIADDITTYAYERREHNRSDVDSKNNETNRSTVRVYQGEGQQTSTNEGQSNRESNRNKSDNKGIENSNTSSFSNVKEHKQQQLDIIQNNNPMEDDYHTGIRTIEDIKTLEETLQDGDWADYDEFNPDLTRDMIEEAIKTGKIVVYSSYPIQQGVFISPSYMEAESYSSDGNVYSKEVNINDVAWIDPTQGQYANTDKYSLSNKDNWNTFLEENFDLNPNGTQTYGKDYIEAPNPQNNTSNSVENNQANKLPTSNTKTSQNQNMEQISNSNAENMQVQQEKSLTMLKNSTEKAQQLLNKFGVELTNKGIAENDNIEVSNSGHIYEKGKKPTLDAWKNGLKTFYEIGDTRLVPIDINDLSKGYNVETWSGQQWFNEDTTPFYVDSDLEAIRAESDYLMNEQSSISEINKEDVQLPNTLEYLKGKRTKEKATLKDIQKFGKDIRQKLVNKGEYIDSLAEATGNKDLTYSYDRRLASFAEAQSSIGGLGQTDINGNVIGKNINEIFKPSKDAKLYDQFNDYLLNRHNIDRTSLEKAIYGDNVTKTQSQQIVDNYEKTYPEFKKWAEDVYKFNRNELKNRLDAGFISQKTYDSCLELYQSYVPTYRDIIETFSDYEDRVGSNPFKNATKNSNALLYIDESMAEQEIAFRRAYRTNEVGKELYKSLGKDSKIFSGIDFNDPNVVETIAGEVIQQAQDGTAVFTIFDDGEMTQFKISEDIYKAFETNKIEEKINNNKIAKVLLGKVAKISEAERNLLTTYSIGFAFNNPIKDFQDAVFNTKYSGAEFVKNWTKAFYEMATNGDYYTSYKANGGGANSYFNYDTGILEERNLVQKFTDKIKDANEILETAPRLAEYITTLQHNGSINEAMYNSAEITTNFKRGGDVAKAMNKYGVNFLNASIQGFDKQWRNLTGQNGWKGYASLVTRAVAYGVVPAIVNHLLLDDDEDYQDLPDYIKDEYYLFKKGDGEFYRIPKGRVLSIIGSTARRMLEYAQGEEDTFEGLGDTFINQLAPNNPIDSNILAPIIQASTNKTWYDTELVSDYMSTLPKSEQYDAKTDEFSKWLGEQLNISPKKINYVLDQYSGGIGDVILPMLTPYAENNILEDKFTTDAVLKNKHISEFYDTVDELEINSNSSEATDEDTLKYRYMSSVSSEMSELYKQKSEIESSDLTDEEKKEQTREIQKQINELAENALANYENATVKSNYATIGGTEYYKNSSGSWAEVKDDLSSLNMSDTQKNKYYSTKDSISEIYSNDELESEEKRTQIVNTLTSSNLTDKQKAEIYKSYYSSSEETVDMIINSGISFDSYLNYTTQDFSADKDSKGKSISGSAKAKVVSYVNGLDLSVAQKAILIRMKYSTFDDYDSQIISYVRGLSITSEEQDAILKKIKIIE